MSVFIISSIASKYNLIDSTIVNRRIGELVRLDYNKILIGHSLRISYLTRSGYLVTSSVIKYSFVDDTLNIETENSIYTFIKKVS